MNFVASGFVDNGYFIRDSDTQGSFRFDGLGKKAFVNLGVTSITIADLYSRWVDWSILEDNLKFSPAMRFSGYDPIPGGFTGTTFFMSNGWRLVYDPNVVAVAGVLYSDTEATAYWNAVGNPIYPATVSALVNSAVTTQNVVTGTALTEAQTANAVWTAVSRSLTTTASVGPTAEQISTAVWEAVSRTLTSAIDVSPTPEQNALAVWSSLNRSLTSPAGLTPDETAKLMSLSTDNLDVPVSSRMAQASYVAPSVAPTASANATAVRSALATELARIDVPISQSSTLTAADVWAHTNKALTVNPPTAVQIAQEVDNQSTQLAAILAEVLALPNGAEIAASVWASNNKQLTTSFPTATEVRQEIDANSTKLNSILSGVGAVPTSLSNASAVRAAMAVELARLDVAISTAVNNISAAEVTAGVRTELSAELAQLSKVAKIHGVGVPLVVTPTSRTAGTVNQSITVEGETVTISAA